MTYLGSLSGTSSSRSTGLPPEYQRYGEQTAAAILSTVSLFPPGASRQRAMKRALDMIHPKLHAQVEGIGKAFEASGVPSKAALQAGLTHAMGSGLMTETEGMGRTGRHPMRGHLANVQRARQRWLKPNGQLGALGALNAPIVGAGLATTTAGQARSNDNTVSAGQMINVGGTTNADGSLTPGPFMFPADQDIVVLNFINPGEGVYTAKANSGAIYNAATGVMTQGQNVVFSRVSEAPTAIDINDSGTFTKLPAAMNITKGSQAADYFLSPAAQATIVSVLSKDCSFNIGAVAAGAVISLISLPVGIAGIAASKPCITSSMVASGQGNRYGALGDFLANLPTQINQDYIYIEGNKSVTGVTGSAKGGSALHTVSHNGGSPILVTTHPVTGKDYGIFLTLGAVTNATNTPWGADPDPTKNNPVHMTMIWAPMATMINKDWLQSLVAFVMHLASVVFDAIVAIAKFAGDLACALLAKQTSPAAIASRLVCNPPPQYPPAPDSNLLPVLIICAVGLTAVLTLKKKKAAP